MIDAYIASSELLCQQRLSLGHLHYSMVPTTASEVAHLKLIFGASAANRGDLVALMKHIDADKRAVFSKEQHVELIEAATARLSQLSMNDGTVPAGNEIGAAKCQTHITSFNYYTHAQWDDLMLPSVVLLWKFRLVSKIWLSWGLIYPSGPSFRIGLATIIVACNFVASAEKAHELLLEFVEEFRSIRSVTDGLSTTFNTFPSRVEPFVMLHGDRLSGPIVDCRICPQTVREWSLPRKIPSVQRRSRSGARHPLSKLLLIGPDRQTLYCKRWSSRFWSVKTHQHHRHRQGGNRFPLHRDAARRVARTSTRQNAGRRRGVASPRSVQTCVVTLPTKIATLA